MTQAYTSRRSFAAVVRRARAEGRISEYAKHTYGYTRMVSLTDGTYLLYRGPGALVDPCERAADAKEGRL